MNQQVSKLELDHRIQAFKQQMGKDHPQWEMVIIVSKINQYYFTGSMQDGMVIITKENDPIYWVRRAFERAKNESPLPDVRPMKSYRNAAAAYKKIPLTIYIEANIMPISMSQRLQRYFPCEQFVSVDQQIAKVRAVKSDYELYWMRQAGKAHQFILEQSVPEILKEGISEATFTAKLYEKMIDNGYQGITRFAMFDTEVIMGQFGFGDNSSYPCYFNGPGGMRGLSPAAPVSASAARKLCQGDLVFVDIGFGMNGYHTDSTLTYVFGRQLPDKVIAIHKQCREIQQRVAEQLKPGAILSDIYLDIMGGLDESFKSNFMGKNGHQVPFLGHGIGLQVDEYPVIAKGFDEPIQENMVFAIEPKKAVPGIGTVGVEDTYIVTANGAECITGENEGLVQL